MRRAGLLVLPCALVGAYLWTREDAPPEAEALPGPKVMVVATPTAADGMLPAIVSGPTNDVLPNIITPMFTYSFRDGAGLTYSPLLALAWAWSDDGRYLSIVLRDDLTWSDGHPVTAGDVAFTWEQVRDPALQSPRASFLDQLPLDPASGWPENPTAVADDVLLFRFAGPGSRSARLLSASAPPTPRHALTGVAGEALRQHALAKNPLASAAFRLAAPATAESFVLEPNPSAPPWMKPALDRVEFRVIVDESTRVSQFIQGQADLVQSVAPSAAAAAAAQRPGTQILDRGRRTLEYLVFNPSLAELQTAEGRAAVAAMLDIDRLMQDIWSADGTLHAQRARGVICPALLADDALPLPPTRDIPRAQAALAALGWADHNGDGRLDRDGTDLTLHLLYRDGSDPRKQLAIAMQQQLIEGGIQLILEEVNKAEHDRRLVAGSFEIALQSMNVGLGINPSSLASDATHRTALNPTAFRDPEVVDLVHRGLDEPDPARAAEIWLKFQRQHLAKAPVIPLWWRGELALLAPGFHDVHVDMVSTLHDLHLWQAP